MLTNQKLDELDRQVKQTQTPGYYPGAEDDLIEDLDTIARQVPELIAEIRMLRAELGRGEQVGMVDLLRESREASCT